MDIILQAFMALASLATVLDFFWKTWGRMKRKRDRRMGQKRK